MKKRRYIWLFIIILLPAFLNMIKVKSLDNYEITTKQQFIDYLLNDNANMNGSYILASDLDFTTGTVIYNGVNYTLDKNGLTIAPIGEKKNTHGVYEDSFNNPFKGTFNGAGHVIKGLNIRSKASDNEYVGLFGYNEGIISNLGLVDSTVDGGVYVGGIAGYNIGTIIGCYNTSSITGIGTVGGITGINYGYIRNSYNTGYVGGATKIGGIVGHNSSIVTAVYDLGIISGELTEEGVKEYGYIFGYNNSQGIIGYVEDDNGSFSFGGSLQTYSIAGAYYCSEYDFGVGYNLGYVKSGETKYDNVNTYSKTLEELKDLTNYDEGFKTARSNIYPIGSSYSHRTTGFFIKKLTLENNYPYPVVGTSEYTTKHHIENSIHSNGYSGSGTIYNPYIITNEAGLNGVRNSLTSAYKLGNNISLKDDFIPIGEEKNSFRGIFNGNGKRISGLNINSTQDYIGLFAFNSGIIHNVSIDVNINTPNASKVGGIAGFNNGQILESYVKGNIIGLNTVGGIAGANELGLIKNSYNLANISGSLDIGGISGYNSGLIKLVYSATVPSFVLGSSGRNVGGIVGYNENSNGNGQVDNALHVAPNQIGYLSSESAPFTDPNSRLASIDEFKSIHNFNGFDISNIAKGQRASTIWAIEHGVNNDMAFLTNTQPIRLEGLEIDRSKQFIIGEDIIRVFDEDGRLILGTDNTSYGVSIDLNEFLIINPSDAENKNVVWSILEQRPNAGVGQVLNISSSTVSGLTSGTATIRATSEDGAKTLDIEVVVLERVSEVYLVNKKGGTHTNLDDLLPESLELENFSTIPLYTEVLPFDSNKQIIWTSSNNSIATVDANGIVKINYPGDINNPVKYGKYTHPITVVIRATSVDNSAIYDEITLVINPSSITNLGEDLKVYEKGTNIPLAKDGNKYSFLNPNQLVKFDTDYLELVFSTNYNQKFVISNSQGNGDDTLVDGKRVYITKGVINDNQYTNRENIISITIISESGQEEVFTLEVVKALSSSKNIQELNVSMDNQHFLSYSFNNNKFKITSKIPYGTSRLYFNPTLVDTTSKYSKSQTHQIVYSFNGDDTIYHDYVVLPSQSGISTITMKVIAEDGTEKLYEIEYEMGYSDIDTLDELFIGQMGGTNFIDFNKNVKNYNFVLDSNSLNNILVKATPTGDASGRSISKVFMVIGSSSPIETNSVLIDVLAGTTITIQIKVLSEENINLGNEEYNIYTINITAEESDESSLESLEVNGERIDIIPNVYNYTYLISGDISNDIINNARIKILSSPWSKLEVTYLGFEDYFSGDYMDYNIRVNPNGGIFPINIGLAGVYRVKVKVIAQNNINYSEYFIDIIRQPSRNSNFKQIDLKKDGLSILPSPLIPNDTTLFSFDDMANTYTLVEPIIVPYETFKVTIGGIIYRYAHYKLANESNIYSSASLIPIELNTSLNEIIITVIAEDPNYKTNYVIKIIREYNSNTPYKVEHYLQDFSGAYLLYDTENLTGLALSEVSATKKNYRGFTFNTQHSGTITEGIISEDGSLVLRLYYLRNSYDLNILIDDISMGSVITEGDVFKYDYNVLIRAIANPGYIFIGWFDGEALLSTNPNYSFNMPDKSLTLRAKFNAIIYKIDYVTNSGVNHPNNPLSYNILDLPINILNPTRDGYVFGGWYDNKDFLGNKITVIDSSNMNDLTLYAQWIINENSTYKIEHYRESLSGVFELFETENLSGTTHSFVEAQAKNYPGFTFDQEASGTIISGEISEDGLLVLRVYYLRNTYPLRVENDNPLFGSISKQSSNIKYDEKVSLSATPNLGYTFMGWYNGEVLISDSLEYEFNMPNYSLDLTAKFSTQTFNITYVLNSGINNINNPNHFTINDLPLSLFAPTREGYTFDGWFDNIDYSGNIITVINEESLKEIILYAKWTINTYEVNFETNGGPSLSQLNIEYNELVPNPNINRLGYQLLGWYQESTFTTKWDFSNNRVKSNMTLYASWQIIEYEITYDYDGGKLSEGQTNPTTYTIKSDLLEIYSPTKEGHTFVGWYNNPQFTGDLITNIPHQTTGNIDLYAKYEIHTFDISITISGRGSITSNVGEIVENVLTASYGSSIIFTLAPVADFELIKLIVNGVEQEISDSYEFNYITQNHTLEVVFAGIEPDVLTLLPGSGYGDKVYSIDRTKDVNLFMDYYIGQKASAIRACFENSPDRIKFFNTKDIEINDSQVLGTGYIIRLYKDNTYTEVIDEVYVVLVGDVNGDGVINVFDAQEILIHVASIKPFTSTPQLVAGNPKKSNFINVFSAQAILLHISFTEPLYT